MTFTLFNTLHKIKATAANDATQAVAITLLLVNTRN